MSATDGESIRKHVNVYFKVFGALAVLTVITVAVSYLNLGVGAAVPVALVIAAVKAALVALFFMHLKGETKGIQWGLILTAVFFLALILLPLYAYLDRVGG